VQHLACWFKLQTSKQTTPTLKCFAKVQRRIRTEPSPPPFKNVNNQTGKKILASVVACTSSLVRFLPQQTRRMAPYFTE